MIAPSKVAGYSGNRPSGHAAVHVDEIGLRQQHHRRYEYEAGDSFAPRLATEAHAAKHIASGHPDNRMCGVGPGAPVVVEVPVYVPEEVPVYVPLDPAYAAVLVLVILDWSKVMRAPP